MSEFAPPPNVDFVVDIDEKQARFFAENGYLALGRVTTDEELEWLRTVYDALLAQPMSGYPDTFYDAVRPYGTRDAPILGQLLFPEQRVPAIKQTALLGTGTLVLRDRLMAAARRRLPRERLHVVSAGVTPRAGPSTPPHERRSGGGRARTRRRHRYVGSGTGTAACRRNQLSSSAHFALRGPQHDRSAAPRVGQRISIRADHARRAGKSPVGDRRP
jgi:hypothetical protein